MTRCESCDGIIGVDCFNPSECAWIEYQQNLKLEQKRQETIKNIKDRLLVMNQPTESLQSRFQAHIEEVKKVKKIAILAGLDVSSEADKEIALLEEVATHLSPRPMSSAPQDGTRILLHHHALGYEHSQHAYIRQGTSWCECRWISDQDKTGSPPHWEPWRGRKSIRTTHHILPENAIAWLPLPQSPATPPEDLSQVIFRCKNCGENFCLVRSSFWNICPFCGHEN